MGSNFSRATGDPTRSGRGCDYALPFPAVREVRPALPCVVEAVIDLAALRALAEAATPGPWRSDGLRVRQHEASTFAVAQAFYKKDAAYIAACSPNVVLGLIARIEDLEEKCK